VKRQIGETIEYGQNQYTILDGADALIIATEWNEFRTPDFELLASGLKSKVIFDGRNVYSLDKMKELGFTYFSIGRETIK
jgi:UDPglucose 6-dehydrogenase